MSTGLEAEEEQVEAVITTVVGAAADATVGVRQEAAVVEVDRNHRELDREDH